MKYVRFILGEYKNGGGSCFFRHTKLSVKNVIAFGEESVNVLISLCIQIVKTYQQVFL